MSEQPEDAIILVRVNCPSRELAEQIGEAMVARGLAPCVNIGGAVDSVYMWEGRTERMRESILWLKVKGRNWPLLVSGIAALHPDEAPAILGLPVWGCHGAYARWLDETSVSADA